MTYAIFSKSKRGTTKFNRLATIHCVVDGCRFTLGIEIMRKENTTADMVKKLISGCKKYGIRISSVTLDREFHSVKIINLLKKMNVPVLMPAVKTYSVKKAIKEFDCTKREAISAHTIKSTSKHVATYTLVIIKNQILKIIPKMIYLSLINTMSLPLPWTNCVQMEMPSV